MAKSGYKDIDVASYIKLRYSWEAGTQNITSNYTPINWKLQLISSNSSAKISSSASKDYSVTTDGTKKSGTNTVGLSGGATKTLASGSKNIYHNSDGTKTFNYSFSQEFEITYSGSKIGTKSGSGSGTLDTIPRGSKLGTVPNFTTGSSITIPITKYSSSFTDNLTIKIGSTTIKTVSDVSNNDSISFTSAELTKIYNALPNATKGTVTWQLTTKNGSATIGTNTKTSTVTINSSIKPNISGITLAEAVSGLATKFSAYIQNQSKITGTVNATAGSGSSIESYKTTINGTSYTSRTFTTGVLKTSGTNTVSVTVTDKRGRTATYSTTFSVLAYSRPNISTFKVDRCKADGTLYDEGTNFKVTVKSTITALNNKNDKTYLLEYKLSTGNTWTTIPNTLSGYTVDTNFIVTNIALNIDNVYDFRLTVKDYFEPNGIPKTAVVQESFTLMNFGADGHSMAIGGVAEDKDVLDIKMKKTYISDNSYVGGDRRNDNEKNLYFQSSANGQYNHNCKVYGGNGSSETSIGMWDSVNSHLIYRYLCSKEEFHFGGDIKILQNNKPVLVEKLFNYGGNTGNFRTTNGFALQWGKVSVTPTAANESYKATVKFSTAFSERPNIIIIPQTSAPQSMRWSIGQGSAAVDSFDIYLNRTTATATSFQWIATGRII